MSGLQLASLSSRLLPLFAKQHSSLVRHYVACRLLYTNSDSDDVGKQTKSHHRNQEKVPRFTKLHQRVLTEDEIEREKKFKEWNSGAESDTFGNLSQPEARSAGKNSDKSSDWVDVRSLHATKRFTNKPNLLRNSDLDSSWSEDSHSSVRERKKRVKNLHNKFGTLGSLDNAGEESLNTEVGSHNERFSDDEDEEERPHIRLATTNRRHSQDWYGLKIEKFGKRGQVKEAVAVLEDWMLKRDRVMPSTYTFTALIGILGRVGYTKKAFSLFNRMKKMGLQPVELTYTSLFNACANSPWRHDGISRADKLRNLMQYKGHEPNLIIYHSMIKAYAMHGELQTAFSIMDELVERFQPTPESFSFLLMACISDKKAGFKHAVEVWRLLLKFKVRPDLPLYNLLLRSVRECGAGSAEFANQLLGGRQEVEKLPLPAPDLPREPKDCVFSHSDSTITSSSDPTGETITDIESVSEWWADEGSVQKSETPSSMTANLPNLLDPDSDLSQVMSVGELRHPEDRMAVIGGVAGFLESMMANGAAPDIRTFSQLIEVAPSSNEAELALIGKMESLGVKPDVPFFNTIMHKRCFRHDGPAARAVLAMITAAHLHPDMRTFGCLAMTCTNRKDGMQLLKDMDQSGLAPNIEILGTLAYASRSDFGYKLDVLKEAETLGLRPNNKFIEVLERSIAVTKHRVVQVEKGNISDSFLSSEYFSKNFRDFMIYYKSWLHKTQAEERSHPWQSFRKQDEEKEQNMN